MLIAVIPERETGAGNLEPWMVLNRPFQKSTRSSFTVEQYS